MKQSEIHTEKDFRKRSGSSSHYRINSGGFKVQLMAVTDGDKPTVKNEFLMCQTGFRHEFIVASLQGNNTVKLFILKDFIKYEYEGRNIPFITLTFEEYINPKTLQSVVSRQFLGINTNNKAV